MYTYIHELKVGGLYDTVEERMNTIELFKKPHSIYARAHLHSTYGSLLLPNDCFVVLEVQLIHDSQFCLKLLTTSGNIGWTSELHYDLFDNPYYFKQVTQPNTTMRLPLSPEDLEVGKLYKGIWLSMMNEAMTDIWLLITPEGVSPQDGILVSMECLVLLEKEQDPNKMTWYCKLLTSKGQVGWAYFSIGTHWFKELKE